ncbi:hypothetical protein BT69DRAFT_1355197 [Atractiella rhizophila]|nr:hypothetical protein BT69DRAFT_1355197 [Atractiella rhizophila]
MRQQSLIASLFLASASAISHSDRGQPGHSFVAKETAVCKELDFKVTAGATNVLFNITAPSTQADFAAALNAILTGQLNPVGGTKNVAPATYKIHGQYCSPAACDKAKRTSDKKRENAIQVIHHSALEQGITEFDIKVKPDIYSYQRQAAESGLSTLVIERLGSGQSDIPEDGINLVQSPLHVEMFHQIVKGVKDGTLLGKKFSTVKLFLTGLRNPSDRD